MLEEKITEVLGKLVELGERLGTPAFDAVVRGVQLDGMLSLIVGGGGLLLSPLLMLGAVKGFRLADSGHAEVGAPLLLGFGFAGFVTAVIGISILTTTSHWIAALDPVAEIARRLVVGG